VSVLAAVLAGIAGVELAALIVLVVLLARSRRAVGELQAAAQARDAARRIPGRAVRAVVETAARVREQGVGGMLMSSLEELTRWSAEERTEIVRVAAPDGTVTIFFSDIEDSTPLNERLGDAAWVRLLGAHNRVVRGCVERHSGHVVKTQGDGFMIVFGAADEAVRAAIDIQGAMRAARFRRLRADVRIRIGIHTGRAVSRDGDYFGRNVAMTARIAAHAHGGEILVSDEVRAGLADDEFVLEPLGEIELKGLADRHSLWSVASARSSRS
jgi:class 3 adenylate cyclase